MDIQKEKEAFINVYVNYKDDSRKIQFNEETEQFMWRKNNVSDTEVEYVHLMNQRWYAWLACAKSKAQAVPEGFVLIQSPISAEMQTAGKQALGLGMFGYDLQDAVDAMVETQEKAND